MTKKVRRWALRAAGSVILPAVLVTGLGAASASAQPTGSLPSIAAHVPTNKSMAGGHFEYVYSYGTYGDCVTAGDEWAPYGIFECNWDGAPCTSCGCGNVCK